MADTVAATPPGRRFSLPRSGKSRLLLFLILVVLSVGIGLAAGRPGVDQPAVPGASSAGAGLAAKTAGEAAATVPTDSSALVGAPAPGVANDTAGAPAAPNDAAAATKPLATTAVGPQIARTATVALTAPAKAVSGVLTDVSALASRLGGSVGQSQTSESGSFPSGTVTLRIPSAKTDEAITALRKLGKVVAVTTAAEDVTGQVIDTGARLRALERSRDRYLDLLSKATTIGETLQVQQRIDDVQVQIEQLAATKAALADRTSLSTIAVTVSTADKPEALAATGRSGLAKAWDDAKTSFGDGVEAVVAASGTAAFLLVLLLVVGVLAVGVRGVLRRRLAH
jgi:hypothetical protein